MTTHSARPRDAADTNAGSSLRDAGSLSGSPYVPAAGALLHGAAFALLCLWTRTSPDRLRDQLAAETGACSTLGF